MCTQHWWYKQLKRQGWIIACWKTVLHRLWGAFWREYNILKGLQTLTLLHDSLLSKELDGVKDGERWQGPEESAGDRLKHSRGYEKGQKFPASCMCVGDCVCACRVHVWVCLYALACKNAASLIWTSYKWCVCVYVPCGLHGRKGDGVSAELKKDVVCWGR